MNVVIAGGGTAGHVNPAIALARALEHDHVTFVGTRRGIESSLVPDAGFELDLVDVAGFDRAHPAQLPMVGLRALRAAKDARRILGRRAPSVVVGMGGYVSLPVVVAARSRSVPIVVHEQNIVLGLANRVARRMARRVAVSFEATLEMAGPRAVHVGNPVLPEIAHLDRDAVRSRGYERFGLDPARRTVIVFGGSLGAATLNDAAPDVARHLAGRGDAQILHISGGSSIVADPGPLPNYVRIDHTDAMHEAYAVADLAICRGGATTVAELTATGTPSIIVPYPHHRDRQQERHGAILQGAGAAIVVPDRAATGGHLAEIVAELLSGDRLGAMGSAALALGRPDAAERLARVVRDTVVRDAA